MWKHKGHERPDFAIAPGPGRESVWDYPRPPIVKRDARRVEVRDGDLVIATTTAGYRVLETASPPSFYVPPGDIELALLVETGDSSVCEWKGMASYFALASAPDTPIAWVYPRPRARFDAITDYFGFYPGRVACFVDDERVAAQPGRFYGGWVTSEIVGPFKGMPGTGHW